MKTVAVFFVAFILVLAALQANAEGRQLLNEGTLGRKANVGGGDAKGQVAAADKVGAVRSDDKANNDVDEVNPTYQSYSNSGTSPDTHHYYASDERPIRH
ncbi:hypothetical protein FH972_015293 [Carpinus fangiana]|uniref:Uncharacterized protein n=1 Tax=Carpinus fangiana TaxID=176857 RepID=A0A5N6RFQ8_9ROSI|nr:hypothetical protein FH972_015293 [Carpinus fangiana]KAE8076658.1 hypothetical protein FH972_015293 [Carpinus fangiana]